MELIIGGAFQGKLDYAKEKYGLTENDIFTCSGTEIDFSRRCIASLEEFTFACVRENRDPVAFFQENKTKWQDSILICRDIFCGVVPLGADMRAWRQQTGLLSQYLSACAVSVVRIYCGLEQKIK